MHKQIDRIYELSEYMRFHSRSFKKLLKLKDTMYKSPDDDNDPVWDEMDDAVEDLDQYAYYMDTLKERFLNLIELVSEHVCQLQDKSLHYDRSSTLRTLTSPTIHATYPFSRPCISQSHISP